MRKKGKTHKAYTKKEIDLILSVDGSAKSFRDLSIIIGRSPSALRKKRWELEHKNYSKEVTQRYRQKADEGFEKDQLNQKWTREEERYLLDHPNQTDATLARHFGRTRGAVQIKRTRLYAQIKERGQHGLSNR